MPSAFSLNEMQQRAFQSLKVGLLNAPPLSFPHFECPFGLATDAPSVGLGCVLFQPSTDDAQAWSGTLDDKSMVISFHSRALSKSERAYSATKRELLVVVFSLDKCRFYVWGRRFTLYTDHRSLIFLFTQRDASPLLQRWFTELLEYQFDIVHIAEI